MQNLAHKEKCAPLLETRRASVILRNARATGNTTGIVRVEAIFLRA